MYLNQCKAGQQFAQLSANNHAGALTNSECVSGGQPDTLVSNTSQCISARAAHLHGLVDRIARVTDRVFGCEQSASSPPEKESEPYCETQGLSRAIVLLDSAIERLEYQACRVEKV